MKHVYNQELYHYGILGMKWGVRRYQNKDGTLTEKGKKRYGGLGIKKDKLRWVDKTAMRRQSSRVVYFGKDKPGPNQQKILDKYKKEADNNPYEKKLTEMDKQLIKYKKQYDTAKKNNDIKTLQKLDKIAYDFQNEYTKNMIANSQYGLKVAEKYVKDWRIY